jgi:acyl carrier protein
MQVKSEIKKFITENFLYGQDGDAMSDDASFLETGIIDSTGVLELVSFIQEKYQIYVSDDELVPENLDSLNRLAAFIEKKSGNGNGQLEGRQNNF